MGCVAEGGRSRIRPGHDPSGKKRSEAWNRGGRGTGGSFGESLGAVCRPLFGRHDDDDDDDMRRKRTGLEAAAFEPPFYTPAVGSHAYSIPEAYETELLDLYTQLTGETPDVHVEELAGVLERDFGVPVELVPEASVLRTWAIEGTDVVDFEKWLYNGYFWLLLRDHLGDVDMLWQDVWAALRSGKSADKSPESLRTQRLYLSDVKRLVEIGKLDASAVGMLQTAGGGKVYVGYVDFFVLLGRLGAFQT